jgi:hypothetical protein
MKQYFKDFIHNVIVHPLMMFLPHKQATRFHDWNARWAFKDYYDELEREGKKQEIQHNVNEM